MNASKRYVDSEATKLRDEIEKLREEIRNLDSIYPTYMDVDGAVEKKIEKKVEILTDAASHRLDARREGYEELLNRVDELVKDALEKTIRGYVKEIEDKLIVELARKAMSLDGITIDISDKV